jgi:hypothetical protein
MLLRLLRLLRLLLLLLLLPQSIVTAQPSSTRG